LLVLEQRLQFKATMVERVVLNIQAVAVVVLEQ
jgi:hypothetical protein